MTYSFIILIKMCENLKLQSIAIGSLPHKDVSSAMNLIKENFAQIPFVPQLINLSKNEDMIIQFLEGLPSFHSENGENFVPDMENEEFIEGLEEFLTDYEEIISDLDSPLTEKYQISENFSHAFKSFEELIKETTPPYAKAQIIGPFTLLTTLTDKNGNYVIYDETFREIIIKILTLKALWQIKRIKKANPATTPIIFMDEPTVSQLGTCAYLTVNISDVVEMITQISDITKANGALSAVHCCGKFDWSILTKTGVDIIDFDAYSFAQNLEIYHKEIENYLHNGGKISWGIVPTLDEQILSELNTETLVKKYLNSVNNLTKKGIDEKLIINNSILTPSCGAGSLSVQGAERAMSLVHELSLELKKRF